MRALILTCDTGGGHNACAEAIKEEFLKNGAECETADALAFVSGGVSSFLSWGHVFVYRHLPWLFGIGYEYFGRRTLERKERSLLYRLFSKGAEPLQRRITEGGFDTVISAHPFASIMLSETQKRHPLPIKTAFVATDYTCSPGVKLCSLDYCFVPHQDLASEFACPRIPRDTILPAGIPVRNAFRERHDASALQIRFGIPKGHKHIVVMSGSMGCGPIEKVVGHLMQSMDNDTEISVVCGSNRKLLQRLEKKYADRDHLHLYGFLKEIPQLFSTADILVTKPGGLSISEAKEMGIPLVLISAVKGCEEYNLRFFLRQGWAVSAESPDKIAEIAISLLSDSDGYNRIKATLDSHPSNAAETIYRILAPYSQKSERTQDI